MASKPKFFSWSRGHQPQPSPEPYHRTGGLLPIDTSVGDTDKEAYLVNHVQNIPRPERRRPPNLNLAIPSEYHEQLNHLSPASAHHNVALVNSASNLLAIVNGMLRSPALSATFCPRSPGIHKPLPNRPRSVSMPTTPQSLVELPGSILLENQGFPVPVEIGTPEIETPSSQTMRSVRSGSALGVSAAPAKPSPSRVPQHKKSLSEASLQRRSKSKPNLITSPTSTDSKLTACSVSTNGGHSSSNDSTKACVGGEKLLQPAPLIVERKPGRKSASESSNHRDQAGTPSTPTPTTTRSRQIEELKSTITAQDNTISTLHSQFSGLRASHDAHVARLVESHSAEVASLKNYTRVLEEQQSQRTLHHASSNHLLLFLDPNEPQSPTTKDSPGTSAGGTSATSIRSFQSAFEQPTQSPVSSRDSPEMEHLKRKLSAARRPETGNREIILQLNQYKQNNAALQKQIESLMAKLNQSKKAERNMTALLEKIEKDCTEWQEKASKAEQLEKNALALQNTIDHLEYRLDVANTEKLDAEEHLFNLSAGRSPFDPKPPKLDTAGPASLATDHRNTFMSMSTVFEADSPTGHGREVQDSSTLAAFIAHIERLQEQLKQDDAQYDALKKENEQRRHNYEQLERDHRELTLQLDIQGQMLKKAKETDAHIEQLRTAVMDRESVIGEKEKSLRMAERQLEHHKLLLHAEIRRHATRSLLADHQDDPLPDLATLASKEDIDRWIARLQARLKKERSKDVSQNPADDLATQVKDLRQEIDFYVREIIYYKLDIKGYKSDIKKLKHLATKMGSYGSRASDVDSPTPSQCRSAETPTRTRLQSGTPGLGISNTSSPVSIAPMTVSHSVARPTTPLAGAISTPDPSPTKPDKRTVECHGRPIHHPMPMTPQTSPYRAGFNVANEADNMQPGVSPRSAARLSPERRKPTPPSPDQEKFGEMATNFPLNTPAAPKRHDTQRSMSDSIIQLYTMPRTPEWSPPSIPKRTPVTEKINMAARQRSASVPDATHERSTPERPPRPRYGLYESPTAQEQANGVRTPPRMDVMAEAMRNSPDRLPAEPRPLFDRRPSDPSTTRIRGLSNSDLSRPNTSESSSAIPAPLTLRRPRAGSSGSSTAQPDSPSRHKHSSGSSNGMPFIIGMPSPHNPALISPTTILPPTTCSITGKCALPTAPTKVKSLTSRTGVGGTMASGTPLTSPAYVDAEKTATSYFGSALPVKSSPSRSGPSATHSRNVSVNSSMSMPSRKDDGGGSKGHSRNVSASSIRSAMQLPREFMKGKGRTRKESIGHPTPLASPFDVERDGGRAI